MKDINSKLEMLDMHFSKIECVWIKEQNDVGNVKLNARYAIDTNVADDNPYEVEKVLSVFISDEKEHLSIEIKLNGRFKLECKDGEMDETTAQHLLNINTITIMMPYLRSEVSLVTAQPGLMPVMLPIVDVTKLIQEAKQ